MNFLSLKPVKCKDGRNFDIFLDDKPLSEILSDKIQKKVIFDLEKTVEEYEKYHTLDIYFKDNNGRYFEIKYELENYFVSIEFLYRDVPVLEMEIEEKDYKNFFELLEYLIENEHFDFLNLILDNYPEDYPEYRDFIECFELSEEEIENLDKKFLKILLTTEINIDTEKEEPAKVWYKNIEVIKKGEFPLELMPEYLKEVYKKYIYLINNEHFLKVKYEILKEECEENIGFLFKLKRTYKLFLDNEGKICFSDRQIIGSYFPVNSLIIVEKNKLESLEFGFTKIINFYRFLKFFEKKLYTKAYNFIKEYFSLDEINSFIIQYFSMDELVNFVIEAKFDNFEENNEILDNWDFIDYLRNNLKIFYTRVVGERYHLKNENYLNSLKEGDLILLVWDYKNPYDENALAVLDKNSNQIGYLKKEVAKTLSTKFRENLYLTGRIYKIFPENRPNERIFIEIDLICS